MHQFEKMQSGTWIVPQVPPNSGPFYDNQIIYLFPGFVPSPSPGGDIVQPVLQFGVANPSPNPDGIIGSGSDWIMAAWVQSNGVFWHSAGFQVNANDTVSGTATDTSEFTFFGAPIAVWQVTATRGGNTDTLSIWAENTNPMGGVAIGGALEAYGINSCSDFPTAGDSSFGNPSLWEANGAWNNWVTANPTWSAVQDGQGFATYSGPNCNFGASAGSGGTTLVY